MDIVEKSERTSPGEYFRPIWARRWIIAIIAIVATAGTYVYYNGKPRTYGSSTTLYIGGNSDVQSSLAGQLAQNPDRTIGDLARLIESPQVFAAAEKLVHNKVALSPVSAAPSSGTDFIVLSATSRSPTLAAESVNAYAAAFIAFRQQQAKQQAEVAVAQLQGQLATTGDPAAATVIRDQISQLKLQITQPSSGISQISPAPIDPMPLSPNPKKDAIFALALSLMIGMALAYGLDRLDQRIRNEDDLQPIYGAPIVGELPQVLDAAPHREGVPCVHPDQWESFRALQTNLELASGAKPLRTILVASAQSGEGKSFVVRNLALAYADAGFRVAVVEGDLRRPTLDKLFHVESEPGLTNVLTQVEMLPEAIQPVARLSEQTLPVPGPGGVALQTKRQRGGLSVVTSGTRTESLTAAIAAEGIKSVIARLGEEYEIILVDSAPLLAVSDSVPLAGMVDGVILVARLGLTTESAAHRVTDLLKRVPGARVLGIVANSVAKRPFQYGYGYSA